MIMGPDHPDRADELPPGPRMLAAELPGIARRELVAAVRHVARARALAEAAAEGTLERRGEGRGR